MRKKEPLYSLSGDKGANPEIPYRPTKKLLITTPPVSFLNAEPFSCGCFLSYNICHLSYLFRFITLDDPPINPLQHTAGCETG